MEGSEFVERHGNTVLKISASWLLTMTRQLGLRRGHQEKQSGNGRCRVSYLPAPSSDTASDDHATIRRLKGAGYPEVFRWRR